MNDQPTTPRPAEWTAREKLDVLLATDRDYRDNDMNGRDNIECPVCLSLTLSYHRVDPLRMVAWCATCAKGIKQGGDR